MPTQSRPVLFKGNIILPDRILDNGCVRCEDGVITQIGSAAAVISEGAEIVDAGDGYISPGFVDLHVHGGRGFDFMDGTPEAVEQAVRCHTSHGTTSICPTTTTGRPDQIVAMLDAVEVVINDWQPGKHARVPGVHFYGPYFAPDKVGAHPKGFERNPDPAEYNAAFARGIIRVATCAAELPGAIDFYKTAAGYGAHITCGHSNASWTEMQAGFDAGLRHVDHFWCAHSSVPSIRNRLREPMQASMTEFTQFNKGMSTEIIADGEHLAPDLMEYSWQVFGPDRLILVSDSNRAVDLGPGEYKIGPKENGEPFISNGKVGICPGGGLASSIFGLDHMVRTMTLSTSCDLVHAVRMAALLPARLIKIDDKVGSIEAGKQADITLLSKDIVAERTWVGGVEFVEPA